MRKLALILMLIFTLLLAIVLTVSLSPHMPLYTETLTITAVYNQALATRVRMILGTPIPYYEIDATQSMLAPSRTAIALTRDPSLATSPTPHPIQLTAFQIIAETATNLVGFGPTTLTLPPTATAWACQPEIAYHFYDDLVSQLQMELTQIEIYTSPNIETFGISQPADCGTPFFPLRTEFEIGIEMDSINDFMNDQVITDQTESILSVLTQFPIRDEYGPEATRLTITFAVYFRHRIIDTVYANALAAYEEGLRDEALLTALGGILPA